MNQFFVIIAPVDLLGPLVFNIDQISSIILSISALHVYFELETY
jgi:hypothetical protein